MPNNIAIVGTRGAGKTVFVTVLAKHLSTPKKGVLLIPDSYDIAEYVESNYAKLQRGEWLDSTNTEQMLGWKLRATGKEEQRLTLLDCPGEQIQELFARRRFAKGDTGEKDRELAEYLLNASTVLLLINLQDFLDDSFDEENVRRKTKREHTLKEYLTALKKDKSRRIAIVFTAYNQFRDHIRSEFSDADQFLADKLPSLYHEHIWRSGLQGFHVSAVADIDASKRPKPGFGHEGLERVIEWIVDPVQYKKDREFRAHQRQIQQEQQEQARHIQQKKEQNDASGPKMFEW